MTEAIQDTSQAQAKAPIVETPSKKVFTRNDLRRSVSIKLGLPSLYPDYEPWEFELRLKLSSDAEEARQQYLHLSEAEITAGAANQTLDEICDLLISMPKGFGDLQDNGRGPGPSFKDYVKSSDTETRELLDNIIAGAINLYWNKISPREFRG